MTPALLQNYFFEFIDQPIEKLLKIYSNENIKRLKSMDISQKDEENKNNESNNKLYL